MTSVEDKFDVSLELGLYRKAVDIAYRMRDISRLHAVLQACKDPQLQNLIQDMINKF
jgi:hypothetical protein